MQRDVRLRPKEANTVQSIPLGAWSRPHQLSYDHKDTEIDGKRGDGSPRWSGEELYSENISSSYLTSSSFQLPAFSYFPQSTRTPSKFKQRNKISITDQPLSRNATLQVRYPLRRPNGRPPRAESGPCATPRSSAAKVLLQEFVLHFTFLTSDSGLTSRQFHASMLVATLKDVMGI
jgi:hypothetical protein